MAYDGRDLNHKSRIRFLSAAITTNTRVWNDIIHLKAGNARTNIALPHMEIFPLIRQYMVQENCKYYIGKT